MVWPLTVSMEACVARKGNGYFRCIATQRKRMPFTVTRPFIDRLRSPSELSLASSATQLQYVRMRKDQQLSISMMRPDVRFHVGTFSGDGLTDKPLVQVTVPLSKCLCASTPWHRSRNPVQQWQYVDNACVGCA